MSTTRTLTPSPPPASALHQRSGMRSAPPSDSEPPPLEERLNEVLSLAGVVPVLGPPIILFVGAWVLVRADAGRSVPASRTFVLGAVVLVVPIAAILAPLYFLVRHVRVLITER